MDVQQLNNGDTATTTNESGGNVELEPTEFVQQMKVVSNQPAVVLLTLPTISPRRRKSESPKDGSLCCLTAQVDSTPGFRTNVQRIDSSNSYWGRVFSGMPSWLWSTILHLIVLLGLAWFTLSDEVRQGSIILEVAETPDSVVFNTTPIVLDPVELDEAGEFKLSELAAMEFDSPDLSTALRESVTLHSEDRIDLASLDDLEGIYGTEVDGNLASVGDSSKAKFFGINSYGKKFVFVIDCSGSMKGSRWRRAVSELRQAINGLEEEQEFLVLLYNTQTKVMLDANLQSAAMAVATSDNKRRMFYWLKKQIPNGSTFPGPAVYAALKLRPDAIFLLSDGLLKDNTVNWLKEWNAPVSDQGEYDASRMVRMNTISLDGQGECVMRTIANQNGGVFVSAR